MTGGGVRSGDGGPWPEQDAPDPYSYDELAGPATSSSRATSTPMSVPAGPATQAPPPKPDRGRTGAIWALSLAILALFAGSWSTNSSPIAFFRPVPVVPVFLVVLLVGVLSLVAMVRRDTGRRIRVAGATALVIAAWAVVPPIVTSTLVARQLAAEDVALGGEQNHASLGEQVDLGEWVIEIDVVNRDADDWYDEAYPGESPNLTETAVIISGTGKLTPNPDASRSVSAPEMYIATAGDTWRTWSVDNLIPGVESQDGSFQPGGETRITWFALLPNEALSAGSPITLEFSGQRLKGDLAKVDGPSFKDGYVDVGRQSELPEWLPAEAKKQG